jgi:hypothetical protein
VRIYHAVKTYECVMSHTDARVYCSCSRCSRLRCSIWRDRRLILSVRCMLMQG